MMNGTPDTAKLTLNIKRYSKDIALSTHNSAPEKSPPPKKKKKKKKKRGGRVISKFHSRR